MVLKYGHFWPTDISIFSSSKIILLYISSDRINTSGYIEIIGITGGIIKIFQMVNNTISRIMLKILKSYIKDENQRYREQQREIIKNIIKLKRVDNGLWKILDGVSKSES